MIDRKEIAGVVLAGGKSSRMGFRDKALLELRQKPLIEHVIANSRQQVDQLILSINRDRQNYEYFDLPLVEDQHHKHQGPLVGIHSAMSYCREQSTGHKYLACFAADTPIFPTDIVARLSRALLENESAFACSRYRGQLEPLFSLWSMHAEALIEESLQAGKFGPKLLLSDMDSFIVDIEDESCGLFLNINTESALENLEKLCVTENIF